MNNYFKELLNNGKEFKVCYMVHNSYWPALMILNKNFLNCDIDIYGSSLSYFRTINKDYSLSKTYNYDLIILDSINKGIAYDSLGNLKYLAKRISQDKRKKVTIGYVYFLSDNEREEKDKINEHIIITTYLNGEELLNENIPVSSDTPLELLNIISEKHNNANVQNINNIKLRKK